MKDSASAWLPALFGLLGVLVGGLLTGVVQWWFERRRGHADRRFAARVLTGELAWGRDWLERCVADADWTYWLLMTHRPPDEMSDHIDRLARTSEYSVWWSAQAAQRALLTCDLFANAERAAEPEDHAMDDEDLDLARTAIEACTAAGRRLDPLKT
jgi:hypothetical protein